MTARADSVDWHPVCRVAELEIERGVAALVHGQAVAIFRVTEEEVYALANHDPFARTSVLARGIVGRRDDVPFVASPVHKHAFDAQYAAPPIKGAVLARLLMLMIQPPPRCRR